MLFPTPRISHPISAPSNSRNNRPPSRIFKLRCNKEWRQMALEQDRSKGVKGPCELMRLSYTDLPTLCPPEPMHSQFLGTVKSILERWFGIDVKSNAWYRALSKAQKQPLKAHQLSKAQCVSTGDEEGGHLPVDCLHLFPKPPKLFSTFH